MTRERKITRHTIGSGKPDSFVFLGVVSAEPDYRISVMINRHLGSNLSKCSEEITVILPAGTNSFSRFTASEPPVSLVSNRNGNNILLRKLKNIDFLIVPCETPDRKTAETLSSSLRQIPEITAVFIFDSSKINDRNMELIWP